MPSSALQNPKPGSLFAILHHRTETVHCTLPLVLSDQLPCRWRLTAMSGGARDDEKDCEYRILALLMALWECAFKQSDPVSSKDVVDVGLGKAGVA